MARRAFLFRDAQPVRGPATAAVLFLVYSLAVWLSLAGDGATAVWPGNGLLVIALLILPRRLAIGTAAACAAVNLGMALLLHGSPLLAASLGTVLNLAEAVAVAILTRRFCGAALDMTGKRRFLNFIVFAALPSAAVSALGAAAAIDLIFRKPFWESWIAWFGADLGGLILTVPAVLLVVKARRFLNYREAGTAEAVAVLGLTALMSMLAFGQHVMPMTFMVFPVLILVAFRLGPPGAGAGVLIISSIGLTCAVLGLGPVALLSHLPPERRVQVVQVFLSVVLFTGLPTAAALAERRRMRLRLQQRMQIIRKARRQAEEAVAAKTRFLAVMSHEIRTPLNGVLGFVQLMSDRDDLPESVQRQVGLMGGSCSVLLSLVNDVLDFSKMDAERLELDPRAFIFDGLAASAEAMVRPLVEEKGVALGLDIEAVRGRRYFGDDNRIAQVLLNLLTNAAKFTEDGRIDVRIAPEGQGVRISVRDTGVGVAPESRARLFQPFSQADNSITRKYGGTGLGLAISERLVRLMGGEIGFESREPKGSEFWFRLPLAVAAPAAIEAPVAKADLEGLKVLVVDDHPVNREIASLMLSTAGCAVATSADGRSAVVMAQETAFDLILMDVHMPEMDGLQATRAIRALAGPLARTPILALTADTADEDVARCLAAGMDGHVSKPIRRDELIRAVVRHARDSTRDVQAVDRSAATCPDPQKNHA
jgi:signal transduction histidine kinase/CheY-like chemotaxis protein